MYHNKNILIVSSHYSENLDWLVNQCLYDYKIYTKNRKNCDNYCTEKIFDCENIGYEASSYLSFIIDNYDNLPDYVAFIHGHEMSEHQTDTILNILNSLALSGYNSLNRKDWRNILNDHVTQESELKNWALVKIFYEDIGLDLPRPKKLEYTPCAQFLVSKENILLNKKEEYQKIFNWLKKRKNLHPSVSGRILEHLWCYIFTHNEVEIC